MVLMENYIVAITDSYGGALREMTTKVELATFDVTDDI